MGRVQLEIVHQQHWGTVWPCFQTRTESEWVKLRVQGQKVWLGRSVFRIQRHQNDVISRLVKYLIS